MSSNWESLIGFFNGFKELRQCRRLFIADRKFRSKLNRSQIPHSFLLSNDTFNVPLHLCNLNKSSLYCTFLMQNVTFELVNITA